MLLDDASVCEYKQDLCHHTLCVRGCVDFVFPGHLFDDSVLTNTHRFLPADEP